MAIMTRWFAPAALAVALGAASLAPAPAQAQSADMLTRVLVDVADVVFRNNQPYYRNGNYSADDRLVMSRDRYGRPVYYRVTDPRYGNGYGYDPRYGNSNGYDPRYSNTPPYGRAYGYNGNNGQRVKCNKHGKCKATYYDDRYSQRDRHDEDRYAYGRGRDHREHDDDD